MSLSLLLARLWTGSNDRLEDDDAGIGVVVVAAAVIDGGAVQG